MEEGPERGDCGGGVKTTLELGWVLVCAQLCLTLCNPMDCSTPGFTVHGIFQARIPFPFPGDLPDPEIETTSPASPVLVDRFFTTAPPELGCWGSDLNFSPFTT